MWGDTYTGTRLPDGRMKHFLEVSETRPIRCGAPSSPASASSPTE